MEDCIQTQTASPLPLYTLGGWLRRLFYALLPAVEAPINGSAARNRDGCEALNAQAEQIMEDYGNSILRLAYSYLHNMNDAEDILQDTLIRFLKTAPAFESETHKKAKARIFMRGL
jgi:hypothetical protein